jgi:hypothetical protein
MAAGVLSRGSDFRRQSQVIPVIALLEVTIGSSVAEFVRQYVSNFHHVAIRPVTAQQKLSNVYWPNMATASFGQLDDLELRFAEWAKICETQICRYKAGATATARYAWMATHKRVLELARSVGAARVHATNLRQNGWSLHDGAEPLGS